MAQSVIGALRVNLGLDSAQFESGARRAKQPLAQMRNQFLAVAGAAAALGAAISTMAMKGAAEIDKTAKSARRVGSSIGGFRALEMAAGEAGVAVSTLADAVQTMDRQIARGSKAATAALSRLGIAAKDLEGLEADQKLALISDRIMDLGLTTGQASALLQDLGIRNREMLLAVMAGGDAFRNARRDVEDYGLALSSADSDKIELANDRIGRLGLISQYVGQQLALSIVPAFGQLAQAMTDSLREGGLLRQAIDGLIDNMQRLGTYLAVAVGGFGIRYVAAFAAARLATMTLAGALAFLRGALIRTGIGALVVAAGELVYQFGRLVAAAGGFGNAMSLLGDVARAVWQGMIDSARAIPPGLSSVWNLVKADFYGLIGDLQSAWYSFLGSLSSSLRNAGIAGVADSVGEAAREAGRAWDDTFDSQQRALGSASEQASAAAGIVRDAFGPAREAVSRLNDVISQTTDEMSGAAGATGDFAGALDDVAGAAGGGGGGGGGKSGAAVAADQARDALARLRQEHRNLQATIGMTAQQERIYNATQELGKNATKGQADEVARLIPLIDQLKSAKERMAQSAQNGQQALENLFGSVIDGSQSAKAAVAQLIGQIARVQLMNGIMQLPGFGSAASGLGSLLTPRIPAFANGGNHAGGIRLVGERGAELEATGPARYFSASQTKQMMGGGAANITYAPVYNYSSGVSRDEFEMHKAVAERDRQQFTQRVNAAVRNPRG